MNVKSKISLNTYLLLFVIAVAAIIRFWDYSSMGFMHDELSAVIRSQANSFSELIYKTKTTDVHPVGVPVFVHYWTKMFGTNEMVVKLPFILFGLVSIYYSYKIAEKWFNPTVAILTCAFLATLQFPTMYGQLARPYATGMLFSVMMVWCWTQFFGTENSKNKYAIGFVLFASLCAYNHYFSLLFAGLVGATGLFFLNKQNAKKYLLMCISVIILFVPHISILLFQLSAGTGGEESWLGKPQPDWLLTFLKYLFHYSTSVYLLVAGLFLLSFYFRSREKKVFDKMRIVALVWALLVPCLAYFYSITKTPVLQFSTFAFSLPFLLMFIFSFYGELKTPVKMGLLGIILLINTYTLFAERKHFPLFYKSSYEAMAHVGTKAKAAFGDKNVFIACSVMEGFVDHYKQKYGEFDYLNADGSDVKKFVKHLDTVDTDYFVTGNFFPDFIQVVKAKYPYTLSKEEGFTYSVYCFSKTKPKEEIKENVVFIDKNDFLKPSKYWDKIENVFELTHSGPPNRVFKREEARSGNLVYIIDSTQEYSAGFSAKLSDVIKSRHSILNVSADISVEDSTSNPTIVISIDDAGESLLWRGMGYQEYKTKAKELTSVYNSYLFSGMNLEKHPEATIKIYIWNRDKKETMIYNFKVEVIESNPMIYGLYEPIE